LFGICLKLITLEIIILAKSLLFLIVDILTYIVLLHTEDDNRVKQTWFEVYFAFRFGGCSGSNRKQKTRTRVSAIFILFDFPYSENRFQIVI